MGGRGGTTTEVQEGQDEAWLREKGRRQGRLWGKENKHFTLQPCLEVL